MKLPRRDRISKRLQHDLEARVRDLEDPRRYVIQSKVGKKTTFCYDVEDDCFTFNTTEGATHFKRRQAALAVVSFLEKRDKRLGGVTNEWKRKRFRVIKVLKLAKKRSKKLS